MNAHEAAALYDQLERGRQTTEKHLRWEAQKIVEANQALHYDRAVEVDWRLPGVTRHFAVVIPAGARGYALQLVIEAQLRDALGMPRAWMVG